MEKDERIGVERKVGDETNKGGSFGLVSGWAVVGLWLVRWQRPKGKYKVKRRAVRENLSPSFLHRLDFIALPPQQLQSLWLHFQAI